MTLLSTAQLQVMAKVKDDVGAIDRLAASLDSLDDAVREKTVKSLRELHASKDLAKVVEDTRTPLKTRKSVLKAFRYLKDPRFTPVVMRTLSDADASVRAESALTLSVFGAADAEAALIKALSDADKDVRYYAADALGELKTAGARAAISAALKTETDSTVSFALGEAAKRQSR